MEVVDSNHAKLDQLNKTRDECLDEVNRLNHEIALLKSFHKDCKLSHQLPQFLFDL